VANQTGTNITVVFKPEATTGLAPGASGGTQLRIAPSPGLELKKASIVSNERRGDSLKTIPRMGSRSVSGSYNCELSVATFDALLSAIQRAAWSAVLTSTQADVTSVTQTTSAIVAASGSWITLGFKVGDVIRANITGGPAANNNRNLRVTAVTATNLTVAETLVVDATPRTTLTITRTKKLANGATAVRSSFTLEEWYQDISKGEQYLGCRLTGMKVSCKPGQNVTAQFTFMGIDRVTETVQYFTSPTLTTSIGLIADDSTIRYNGADIASFTGFDFDFAIAAKAEPVIGSLLSPDIFDNDLTVSGTITAIRQDLAALTSFDAETEFATQVLLVENTTEPKSFIQFYFPRMKFSGAAKQLGADGAMIVTLPVVTGAAVATATSDAGVAVIQTSAA
jgi:hypothetical protein